MTTPRKTPTRRMATVQEEPIPPDAQKILGEIGATAASVHIYRLKPDGRESYCGEASARVFSMEYVRSKYGPGDYVVRVFGGDDAEVGVKELSIEPTPEELQRAREGNSPLREILDELRAQRNTPPLPQRDTPDPLQFVAQLGAVSAENTKSMITMLVALMEGMRPPSTPATDPEKLFDIFTRGMEMGKEMSSSGGEFGYGQVVSQLGKPLLEMLNRQRAVEGMPLVQQNEPQPTGEEVAEIMKPARDDNPFSLMAPFMSQLLPLARKNAPVSAWAGVIETQHPDAVSLLVGMVTRMGLEDTLSLFFTTYPQTEAWRAWFTDLLTLLVTEPAEPAEPTEPTE